MGSHTMYSLGIDVFVERAKNLEGNKKYLKE